jgi:hypothetical protein
MNADRPAKRLRGDEQQSETTPPALFGSENPTLEESLLSSGYLAPFDLVRLLLHIYKAAQRATVPKLKRLEEASQSTTKEHTKMFRGWLSCPGTACVQENAMFEEEMGAPEAGSHRQSSWTVAVGCHCGNGE